MKMRNVFSLVLGESCVDNEFELNLLMISTFDLNNERRLRLNAGKRWTRAGPWKDKMKCEVDKANVHFVVANNWKWERRERSSRPECDTMYWRRNRTWRPYKQERINRVHRSSPHRSNRSSLDWDVEREKPNDCKRTTRRSRSRRFARPTSHSGRCERRDESTKYHRI